MNEKKIKRNSGMKGFVLGIAFMLTLSATVVAANPVMRELVFGVGVSFNGQMQEFNEASRPFVIDGTTFLPVRAIADLVGLDVDFNAATNTVLLTTSHGQEATPDIPAAQGNRLADTAFDGTSFNSNRHPSANVLASANMVGATHTNVTHYRTIYGNSTTETHHNLDGAYTNLTGLFGRMDGSNGTRSAAVTILGDGVPIHTFDLLSGQMPVNLDVDVTGVQLLVVQVRSFPANDANSGAGNTQWIMSADLQ